MFGQFGYVQERAQANFMYKVYAWMCVALAVTAVTAWYVAASTSFFAIIIAHPFALLAIFLAQLALVVVLSGMIDRMSFSTAIVLFIIYAISLGLSMSLIFRAYTLPSLATTFIITSGMFGGMALYGYFTRADLTRIGSISMMALWGVILALLVNLFFQSMWFDYLISMVGVAIFSLLTAVDIQKIKVISERYISNDEDYKKVTILGALTLYLDFINLFLFLLRFTGSRRNQ